MICPPFDTTKYAGATVDGTCDPRYGPGSQPTPCTGGGWPVVGGAGILDQAKYLEFTDTNCQQVLALAEADGVYGLLADAYGHYPGDRTVYGRQYKYITTGVAATDLQGCCGCCRTKTSSPSLTGTVTNQTGDCTGLAPTVLNFLVDSDPANCASGNFWTNRLQAQPNIPHLGGSGGSSGYIGICCAGYNDWQLINYAGLTFPGCATFRRDLSSCDPFVLVWDFVGAADPTCNPPYGVLDGYHCGGTFRLVVTEP